MTRAVFRSRVTASVGYLPQFTSHSTAETVGGIATVFTLITSSPRRHRKSHWMASAFMHAARSGKQVLSVLLSHFPESGSDAGP